MSSIVGGELQGEAYHSGGARVIERKGVARMNSTGYGEPFTVLAREQFHDRAPATKALSVGFPPMTPGGGSGGALCFFPFDKGVNRALKGYVVPARLRSCRHDWFHEDLPSRSRETHSRHPGLYPQNSSPPESRPALQSMASHPN